VIGFVRPEPHIASTKEPKPKPKRGVIPVKHLGDYYRFWKVKVVMKKLGGAL
jgi:hypothetical protein